MLELIKKDLLDLRGSDVKIFGQPTTLSERNAEDITVNIIDLVDALNDYEITSEKACQLLGVEAVDDIDDLDYTTADNSYNWSGMVDHDFDYHFYEVGGEVVVSIKFHRFGDVRGNYTETAYLLFDDTYLFNELIHEQQHDFVIAVNRLEFSCTSRIKDEYIRCSAKTEDGYLDLDILAYDLADVTAEIAKELEAIA